MLTPAGAFVVERAGTFREAASYRPMLQRLGTALFGDVAQVFTHDAHGHELHVDRTMNVLASGFMHQRYFTDMACVHLRATFDTLPLAEQPAYIVDMGCGDGRLLRTLFEYVREHTARGAALDTWPLTMVGVDFNEKSLQSTARRLADSDVPHAVEWGDIGDPATMQATLEARFGVGRDAFLHVRSFLDHDRPFVAPREPCAPSVEAALNASSDGVYVDGVGERITPALAFRSAVEHLRRWSSVLGKHGLLLLEVHLLSVDATRRHMRAATSLHFDALQAWSSQMLLPAVHWAAAAAAAGLFSTGADRLCYPKGESYTRIVLQRLVPRPHCIRLASAEGDMRALLALEASKPMDERVGEATLRRRLEQDAARQYVAANADDGAVVGALYTRAWPLPGGERCELSVSDVVALEPPGAPQDRGPLRAALLEFAQSTLSLDAAVTAVCVPSDHTAARRAAAREEETATGGALGSEDGPPGASHECVSAEAMLRRLEGAADGSEKEAAAKALWQYVADAPSRNEVVAAGGIGRLIEAARNVAASGADAHAAYAAATLWNLAVDFDLKQPIGDAGAIPPLVALVASGSTLAKEKAAGALAAIAVMSDKNKAEITACGGRETLRALVDSEDAGESSLKGAVFRAKKALVQLEGVREDAA